MLVQMLLLKRAKRSTEPGVHKLLANYQTGIMSGWNGRIGSDHVELGHGRSTVCNRYKPTHAWSWKNSRSRSLRLVFCGAFSG